MPQRKHSAGCQCQPAMAHALSDVHSDQRPLCDCKSKVWQQIQHPVLSMTSPCPAGHCVKASTTTQRCCNACSNPLVILDERLSTIPTKGQKCVDVVQCTTSEKAAPTSIPSSTHNVKRGTRTVGQCHWQHVFENTPAQEGVTGCVPIPQHHVSLVTAKARPAAFAACS
jgi:hypothetical protein